MDLSRYTPEQVRRRLAVDPAAPREPQVEAFTAAVLWADISGFTPLTERLVAAGPSGVEALTEILNRYYGRLIDLVHAAGGDITQFEGDAILAVWPIGEGGDLGEATVRAAQCALAIQRELHGFEVAEGVRLSQRVAIAAGPMRFLWVGGVLSRWTFVAAGEPLVQVQAIDHQVDPGQVVVSMPAWTRISTRCRGRQLPTGAVQLEAVEQSVPPRALERVDVPEGALPVVRMFLPGAVLSRMQGHSRWLAELRTISVLFVQLPDLDPRTDDVAARAQQVVEQVQHAVYRLGGSIDKLSMADKGATLLAGFGLPPLAHEDDPTRAVQAAQAIVERLQALGMRAHIGVTTGPVFCGLLGSELRCEYATLGRPVNLASRLMQLGEPVLVDEATYQASRKRLGYEPLPPVQVKGVPEPVAVFRPTGEERAVVRPPTDIIGRAAELDAISARLQALVRAGADGVLIVEGEAGIGKSRLVGEAVKRARDLGVRVLWAEAHAIERDTAYYPWRAVVLDLLDVHEARDPQVIRRAVERELSPEPALLRLAPLLSALLPIDLPDNADTAQMHGEVRAANTLHLLSRLVQRAATDRPVLLVVEDAHWLDSPSWAVTARVVRDVHPLLTLVATRPFAEGVPAEFAQLVARPDATHLRLENLDPEQTIQLVRQRLGVVHLPDEVGAMLIAKSGGNPFFTEELAFALRDSGKLLIDNGTCGLAPGEDLESLSLPATVQGAIISRVDRLSPSQQLLLKVASVIGREFAQATLEDVYPSEETGDHVTDVLPSVLYLDIILRESLGEAAWYIFKHVLSQEAIYGLMLFAQRRELHGRVARWYEQTSASVEELAARYPLLAYHWSRAEDPARAVHYLQKAGEQALSRSANHEAVRFFDRGLKLCAAHPAVATPERLRVMQEGLALAHHGAGDMDACMEHGLKALELLGRPSAATRAELAVGLLGQVALRTLQGAWPDLFAERDPENRERRLAAARLENKFSEIAVFREENVRCLYSALRQINVAHPAGPSAELGRAYAVMSTMLGTVPLPRIADAWVGRALDMANRIDSQLHRAYIYNRAACYELYRARWDNVYRLMAEIMDTTERLGDTRLHEENLVVVGLADQYTGKLASSIGVMERLRFAARSSGNHQTQFWGLVGRAECLARLGRAEEALAHCDEFASWLESGAQSSERVWGYATRALVCLRLGRDDDALRWADRVRDLYLGARPVAFWNQQTAPCCAEVYATLLRRRGDSALRGRLRLAVKTARTFGGIFPFGAAVGEYWSAVEAWLDGHRRLAFALWRRAIAVAERNGQSYEQGLAHRDLGRHLPDGPERDGHAVRGRALLQQCGATPDLDAIN